jgi:PAS domain-containing protein
MPVLADARSRVLLVRLGAATIAVFQVLFWAVRAAANPGVPEHAGIRLAILAACAAGGAASVGVREFRRTRLLSVGFALGIMVLQIWLAVASGLTLDYAVPPTILLFAVCSLATDTTELLLFSLTAALAPLVLFAAYHVPGTPIPGVALLGLAGSGAAGAIVSWFRVRTQTELTREIARREEVEVQLRGTRAHLESILNATSDGLLGVRYEAAGPRITFANRRFGEIFALDPETVVGAADEAIRGQAAHHFADPEEFERDVRRLYDAREETGVEELQLVTPRRSMLQRWTGPIRDTHGAVVGRIWAFRDVTSHRDMTRALQDYAARLEATNAELARASRAKDAFLANLSHELRTPLSIIIGYQNLVLEGGLSEAESVEFIQRSTASATHLLRLISDMLDLTRLEAGTAEIAVGGGRPRRGARSDPRARDRKGPRAAGRGGVGRAGTGRSAAPEADPPEPGRQRAQVHHRGLGQRLRGDGERLRALRRPRHRTRYPARAAGAALPQVHASRHPHDGAGRGRRSRAQHLPRAGRAHGRRDRALERRSGHGHGSPLHAAARLIDCSESERAALTS